MKRIFTKIFIGYLFLWLDIYLFVDLLPDPLGFYFIYSAMKDFMKKWNFSSKARIVKNLAILFMILSLPTMFVSKIMEVHLPETIPLTYGYLKLMDIIYLVFLFYLFHLLWDIAKAADEDELLKYTNRLFYVYFIAFFAIYIAEPFLWNVHDGWFEKLFIAFSLFAFILQILFLLLINNYRKLYDGRFG